MTSKAIVLSGFAAVLFAACSSDAVTPSDDGGTTADAGKPTTDSGSDAGGPSCASAGCSTDATCAVSGNAAVCTCKPGFNGDGKTCTKINNCGGAPCKNGGTCVDGADKYTCTCAAGYSGTNCETNIDECAAKPCLNGGTCADGVNKFTCTCAAGYSGPTCAVNIDDCANNPCKNGGTCADGVNKFTCTCAAGYSGATCETNIDDCANNPCKNGGTCTDGVNAFTCACTRGFSGATCDVAPYPTTNLMAYWDFEQANGTVKDQSGNGNDAKTVTATRGNGSLGFGYDFAGGQCIRFANSASLNMAGKTGLTGMMWEQYTVAGGNQGIFFNQENTWELAVGVNGANNLNDALPFPAGWAWFGNKALTINTWQHVAVTWDGATTKHYLDGVMVYSRAQSGTFSNSNYGMGLGCRGVSTDGMSGGSQFLTGSIDEAFVYDRALTDQEILTYFNATKP